MTIAVIPARGGSKRIPRKNIRDFAGRPMIAHAISTAQNSGIFDRIVVSTDDEEIASVASRYGAEVPFIRPAKLSDDHAGTVAVVAHAVAWLQEHGEAVGETCCLYATTPLMRDTDLRSARDHFLISAESDYLVSVTEYRFPVQRALRVNGDGAVEMIYPDHLETRSQDLEPAFHDAGQFYFGRDYAWLENRPLFGASTRPFMLPSERVQDIDTEADWNRAELMFELIQGAASA